MPVETLGLSNFLSRVAGCEFLPVLHMHIASSTHRVVNAVLSGVRCADLYHSSYISCFVPEALKPDTSLEHLYAVQVEGLL